MLSQAIWRTGMPNHGLTQRNRLGSPSLVSNKRKLSATKRRSWSSIVQILWLFTMSAAMLSVWNFRKLFQTLHFEDLFPTHFIADGVSQYPLRSSPYAHTLFLLSMHERTKALLDILWSTENVKDSAIPWPSIMKLHQLETQSLNVSTSAIHHSCIVTAYFRIKSKYSSQEYENHWMKNILSLQDCMVIFCEAALVETMLTIRGTRPTAVIEIQLHDLPIAKYFSANTIESPKMDKSLYDNGSSHNDTDLQNIKTEFWQHQLDLDPEIRRHQSYHLFWIWLSKSWFVSTAATLQYHLFPTMASHHDSLQYWMWADIGSFRQAKYNNKHLMRYPENLLSDPTDPAIIFMAHHTPNPPENDPLWNNKLHPVEKEHFYHSGSHAVGTVPGWRQFHLYFVDTLEKYSAQNKFVGEDQCVLQSTCLLHPAHCAYVTFDQVPDNRYFGLRHVLSRGYRGKKLWRPPQIRPP